MYAIRIERTFSASHAVTIDGVPEVPHSHDWRVRVVLRGPVLDVDGLLCDFHAVEGLVNDVIAPFHNATLNEVPPFDRTNPSAEAVAEHIARSLLPDLPSNIESIKASVTEAPGCEASYAVEVEQ